MLTRTLILVVAFFLAGPAFSCTDATASCKQGAAACLVRTCPSDGPGWTEQWIYWCNGDMTHARVGWPTVILFDMGACGAD